MNNESWFHRFISINEMKTSSLVVSFLIFSGIGVFLLISKGDLPSNLTTLLITLAGIIGGVNAFNFVSSNMSMSKNGQMPMQTNTYGSNMSGYNSYGNMGMMSQPMGMSQSMPMQSVPVSTAQTSTTTISPQSRGI